MVQKVRCENKQIRSNIYSNYEVVCSKFSQRELELMIFIVSLSGSKGLGQCSCCGTGYRFCTNAASFSEKCRIPTLTGTTATREVL